LLTVLCLVALSPAAQAAPAHRDAEPGGVGIQLLEGPANREKDPRAHRYIVDHLDPGTTIRRKIRVVNHSRKRQRITVYPAAATLDKKKFLFGADRAANELTSWVSVDKGQLDLAPGDGAVVKTTVVVPPAASAGERYGVIWAAVGSTPRASGGITQIHRVGIRIYLDIGLGGEPVSDFSIGELVPARAPSGDPSLTATVANTGKRALDLSGSADLTDGPAGQRAGPFPVTSTATLAPDTTGTVVMQFPETLPNGPWKVKLTLKSGLVSHSVTALITFPDPGATGRSGTVMSRMSSPLVISTGSLLVLLLFGALALMVRRHWKTTPAD
jgi:hypothetical protein